MKTDSATSDFSLLLILKQPHSLVPLSIKRFVCLLFSQFILCNFVDWRLTEQSQLHN